MVKLTQTIRSKVFDRFVGLALKGLKKIIWEILKASNLCSTVCFLNKNLIRGQGQKTWNKWRYMLFSFFIKWHSLAMRLLEAANNKNMY